uniref:RxLR effector protein n=1 Tax=Peronospora matthiolae TaxID=2874970 RepID=A0AAV1VPA1_9STRA
MRVLHFSYLAALAVICLFARGDAFAVESIAVLKSDQAQQDASGHKSLRGYLFRDTFSNGSYGNKDDHVIVEEDSSSEDSSYYW